ncbi:MAG: preprotein translocase subunit YajC [Verrucomicrobiales bacterium]
MNTYQAILFLIGQSEPLPAPSTFSQFVPFILIFVIFYFLLIRPQKQKQKKLQLQVDAMRPGDKVITAGGIHGLITGIKKQSVTVKVDNNTKIEFEKSAIATVISKNSGQSEPANLSSEAEETTIEEEQDDQSNNNDRDNFQRDR